MSKEEFIKVCKESVPESQPGLIPCIFPPILDMSDKDTLITQEAGFLYDFLNKYNLLSEQPILGPTKIEEILLVESGSVDEDELEEKGYNFIVYRQGSKPPMFIKKEV